MPELSHTIVELDSQYIKAKNAALRLLAYRSRSEAEVRRRLLGRFTGEVIDRTLSDLRRQGLLNDAAFAKEWREQREKFRPKGPAVIRQELQRLGLNREVIQDALSDFDIDGNAYRAGSRYAAKLPMEDARQFRRKLGGFLLRRGFEGEVLGRIIERLWRELSDPHNCDVDADAQRDQANEAR